jgi:hypothetical protein
METNRPSKLGLFRRGLAALSTCTVLTLASGCNGSSSAGVEPGIGDDPADITALTILGVVTDAPIASADVTATVDGQSFTTMAGTDGTYELEVRFETEAVSPEALVQVTGVGVGPQAGVALVSQVGSIAALVSAAGDDGRLDREEQPRLVVSHLSTARYLLATDINGGTPPASEAELGVCQRSCPIFHAAFLAGFPPARSSFGGFSQTSRTGVQSRVLLVHRSGRSAFAAS